MKKFAIPAVALAFALGACSETNNYEADEADTADTTAQAPVVSETTVVTEAPASDGDRVSVSEDGVSADINDGNTRVRADVDGDPSLTVETE